MLKKSVRDIDVSGQKVLVRADLNVPMKSGIIQDDTRIRETLPTLQYLLKQGTSIVIMSHLGRPDGQAVEHLRLKPVAQRLSELLSVDVQMAAGVIGEQVTAQAEALQPGQILLLENVRFEPGEERNDTQLAEQLAALADVFINDAFGAAHRAHASTTGVAKLLPAVAGLLMEKELEILGKAMKNPDRPFTAIVGGAKVKDKIQVIDHLIGLVDNILIGGGLAYTFLKAQGHEIGKSLCDDSKLELALELLAKAKSRGVQFLLPSDIVAADDFSDSANTKVVPIDGIPEDWEGLDIGVETRVTYANVIKASKLIVWNGPMGVFELAPFSNGTREVAQACAETEGFTLLGGGDSASAVEKFKLADRMDHISTGGGASLEFMEGKVLPGVAALLDR